MSLFHKMETFVYKNFIVPLQGKNTFDFVSEHYQKGDKVLDFGCGIGSNSKLFDAEDYIGVEVDSSRVESAKIKYPASQFEKIPFISSKNDKIPFKDGSFDIIFISLCLHHIDSATCKLLFKEFKRILNQDGEIIGIEPCILPNKYFSNVFMNVVDAGDYIISIEEYKKMYSSESFDADHINIVTTFGYYLWQYCAKPNQLSSNSYVGELTKYRKIIKPIHLTALYGKWAVLFYLLYLIIVPIIN